MGSSADDIAAILEASFTPMVVVDAEKKVRWSNPAAERLFFTAPGTPRTLDSVVGPTLSEEIIRTEWTKSFSVTVHHPSLEGVEIACVACEVGTAAPGAERLLLYFPSVVPESALARSHEEYLASIAHDLKNPIGAIFGYADAILETSLKNGVPQKPLEIIDRIRATATRSLELVRNFQQYAQLERGESVLSTSSTNLNVLIQGVVESMVRPSANQRLELQLSAEPLPIKLERFQAERVLSNLIGNALKYTSTNGSVTVKTFKEDGWSCLTVHNTGSLIPTEEVTTLFDRYTRASTGAPKPGTGLGLHIVKRILDAAHAEITVQSSLTEGTQFKVRIPSAER